METVWKAVKATALVGITAYATYHGSYYCLSAMFGRVDDPTEKKKDEKKPGSSKETEPNAQKKPAQKHETGFGGMRKGRVENTSAQSSLSDVADTPIP
eukprot:gene16794-18489_t